jgi:hypothetical protein
MGFIDSEMYWPITHMVAPADEALQCTACHDEAGRLDFAALGYAEDEVATLTGFPPVTEEPEPTTTTTSEAPTTTAAPTTTEATTTTAAPATTTTLVAGGEVDGEGGNLGLVLGVVIAGAVLVGGAVFWLMRRKPA